MKMFSIFIVVVVASVYKFVKTHQNVNLNWFLFLSKLYLNQVDFKNKDHERMSSIISTPPPPQIPLLYEILNH